MKKLIMIAGPAGVGKTTVCRELFGRLDRCAWLDADWCWMVHPWHAKSDEQKQYVLRAFGHILNGYFADDATDTVLFSWLMHSDFMFDLVTDQITYRGYELTRFVLVCQDRDVHIARMKKDGRRNEQANNPDDMARYRALHARVIDVSYLTPEQVAGQILTALDR